MEILAFNPSHDGGVAIVRDARLICSIESEKDSFVRHEALTPHAVITSFEFASSAPDVIATCGGIKHLSPPLLSYAAGYGGVGHEGLQSAERVCFGRKTRLFSCSHERAHILCAYGLSPFEQGEPCYALVWEGNIGCFYEIGPTLEITPFEPLVCMPGAKYEFLYVLADNTGIDGFVPGLAGKVMALAAFGDERAPVTAADRQLIETLLDIDDISAFQKPRFADCSIYRKGVTSPEFQTLARQFSDTLYERFHQFAATNLTKGHPLLISGGCGLNCEWNSRFRDSGLFRDVFVPPCANDSGIAIGAAIDAQHYYTGQAKIDWTVYAGEPFVYDVPWDASQVRELDVAEVAEALAQGEVIAWVQGRCEIGPRALGNRSLLASPLLARSRDRLNEIKGREWYRPVAPVCLETNVGRYFAPAFASPHMLYLQTVPSDALPAITHVDRSARIQTVTSEQNPRLAELLTAFERRTGCGVLCNTSLNFKGRGFINRSSDLLRYCRERNVDAFVAGDVFGRGT